jgi:hypothetical protein
VRAPAGSVLLTEDGEPVGVSMSGELPADGGWKGSPLERPLLSAEQYAALTELAGQAAEHGVLKVRLNFRSPRKKAGSAYARFGPDDEEATERHVLGVLVGERRLLVLASLPPKVTARLEKITVFPPDGEPVAAEFICSYEDYGALLASTAEPMKAALELAEGDLLDYRDRLLPAVEVVLKGEQREAYLSRRRLTGFAVGWEDRIYPRVDADGRLVFVFDADGKLVLLPLVRRTKGRRRYWRSDEPIPHPVAYVRPLLEEPKRYADASNVPLSEEQENRLAWMGVLLQPLNEELARASNVSHLTDEGETGAMVAYVYPDSPAADAGIQPGDILLRLHVEGEPKPLPVRAEERFGGRAFPWDQLDDLPESLYDRIPTPWKPLENWLTRTLTDLGFSKRYTADVFQDGEVVGKQFTIVQSPAHYDLAPRHESEPLGINVRDMTFEVRRYFQRAPDDPGVIISKIEPGSKASVGGIKPYEIITHVNGEPVHNVEDFAELVGTGGELRLSVRRMTRGRVVKILLDEPATQPEGEEPAGTDE